MALTLDQGGCKKRWGSEPVCLLPKMCFKIHHLSKSEDFRDSWVAPGFFDSRASGQSWGLLLLGPSFLPPLCSVWWNRGLEPKGPLRLSLHCVIRWYITVKKVNIWKPHLRKLLPSVASCWDAVPCVEFFRARSQSVVSVWQLVWEAGGCKAFYRVVAVAAELCKAAQLMSVYLGHWVCGTLALVHLGACLGLGMRLAYSSLAGPVSAFLSLTFWEPLSRLTYTAYLIHVMVMTLYFYNAQMLFYLNNWTIVSLLWSFLHWTIVRVLYRPMSQLDHCERFFCLHSSQLEYYVQAFCEAKPTCLQRCLQTIWFCLHAWRDHCKG